MHANICKRYDQPLLTSTTKHKHTYIKRPRTFKTNNFDHDEIEHTRRFDDQLPSARINYTNHSHKHLKLQTFQNTQLTRCDPASHTQQMPFHKIKIMSTSQPFNPNNDIPTGVKSGQRSPTKNTRLGENDEMIQIMTLTW